MLRLFSSPLSSSLAPTTTSSTTSSTTTKPLVFFCCAFLAGYGAIETYKMMWCCTPSSSSSLGKDEDERHHHHRREGDEEGSVSSERSRRLEGDHASTSGRGEERRGDADAIVARFEAAAAYAATRIAEGSVPEDCILELYGVYKQATKGDCDAKARPTRLDIKGYAKFTEWMKHKGMTKLDACSMYVRVLESRLDDLEVSPSPKTESGRNAEKRKSGGTFGRSQSTMSRLEGEDGEEEEITLIKAAKEGDFDKLLKCLRAGADANQRDAKGRTPLMFAADTGDVAITIQLMQLDADIDATDERGKTALHYATICEQIDVAEVLLEAGADPEARDANGKSASDLGVYELVKKKAKGELSSLGREAVNDVDGEREEEEEEEEEEDFDLEEIERQALERMAGRT